MSWLFASFAALAAVLAEVWFQAHRGVPYFALGVMWPAMVLALVVNFGIWGLQQNQTLIGATIVFSCMTSLVRVGWTLYAGQVVSTGTWWAFALVVLAVIVKTVVR